MQQIRRS